MPHRDAGAVDAALAAHQGRAVVVTDAVFSVDGSVADLVGLHEVARRHGALLVGDEAHGLGVVGPAGTRPRAAIIPTPTNSHDADQPVAAQG